MKTCFLILVSCSTLLLASCSKQQIKQQISYANSNRHFIEKDDFRLHFITKGNPHNPPLLLIHGAPGTLKDYSNLLSDKALQKNFHVIAVDRLGYGMSRKNKNRTLWSIQKQADGIVQALQTNKSKEKAVIVGRSYGAPIAAKIAADYPDVLDKLVLISPVIDPEKEKIFWFAYAAKHWLVGLFLNNEYQLATEEKFAHERELRKMEKDWGRITAEVAVFQGGKDWIADIGNLDFAKRKLRSKNRYFYYLPDAGHMITESHTDLVIQEFTKKQRSRL